MTSIVSWFNEESNGAIWTVGDSKITDGGSSPSILLDSAAKIFSIPLICKTTGSNDFFDNTFLESKVGLAYAGSSLIGLNVYAAITTIFSNLNGFGKAPSMDALAEYTRMIAKSYIDTLAVMKLDGALCEFLLMGYCHVSQVYKICWIRPDFSSGHFDMSLVISDSQTADEGFIALLGDKKTEIQDSISEYREERPEKGSLWNRAPQMVLKQVIAEERFDTIGGYLQQGFCLGTNFTPVSTCMPVEGEEPKAYLSYLGFDVTGDASRVGDCFVGIMGMI